MSQASQNTESAVLVIFGASGDLTRRKLVPALYHLACAELLPPGAQVLGVAIDELTEQAFRERLRGGMVEYVEIQPDLHGLWPRFAERLSYMIGRFSDPDTYRSLGERLAELDAAGGTDGNHLFYLAVPPRLFPRIVRHLGQAGLNRTEKGGRASSLRNPLAVTCKVPEN